MAEPQFSVRSAHARDLAHRLARREGSTLAEIVERALRIRSSIAMRFFVTLALFSSLFSVTGAVTSVAYAQATPPEKWEGFRPIDQVDEPFSSLAKNTVVKIRTFGMIDPNKPFPKVIDIRKIKPVTDEKKLTKNYKALQVETCRRQNLTQCPVFEYIGTGTGFVQDGNLLYTCAHGFRNWISLAASKNNVAADSIFPPMMIFDYQNNMLYNSALALDGELLTFSFFNANPKLNFVSYLDKTDQEKPNNKAYTLHGRTDFAILKINRNLVKQVHVPEVPGGEVTTPGKEIYLFGYPQDTHFFKNKEGDTPGFVLVASHGYSTNMVTTSNGAVTTNFAYSGNSGGPAFTAKGEFAGITCVVMNANNSNDITSHPELVNTTILPPSKTVNQKFWGQQDYNLGPIMVQGSLRR